MQQHPAVGGAQVVGVRLPARHPRTGAERASSHGLEQDIPRITRILVDGGGALGLGDDVITQPLAGAQDRAHAPTGALVRAQGIDEAGVGLAQTHRLEQGLVGIGRRAQVTHPRLPRRQLLEERQGPARVQEARDPQIVGGHRGTTFKNCSSSCRVICWRYSVHSLRLLRMT